MSRGQFRNSQILRFGNEKMGKQTSLEYELCAGFWHAHWGCPTVRFLIFIIGVYPFFAMFGIFRQHILPWTADVDVVVLLSDARMDVDSLCG